MILFFAELIDQHTAILEEDEFTHCIKVLRKKTGDRIHITNGKAWFASAEINQIKKRSATLSIVEQEEQQPPTYSVNLGIAAPKSKNRWDFLLEKAVEVGVDSVTPIITDNSERSKISADRANKIMRSAALQSKRIVHPVFNDPIKLPDLINQYATGNTNKFIAHYNPVNDWIDRCALDHPNSLILIGPEGDFSTAELDLCNTNGFTTVNISNNRLRTETAAIVACSLLASNHHNIQSKR